MAKAFSVASWNVQHFRKNPKRVSLVVDFLIQHRPDVFALYEVEGKTIFMDLVTKMPGYTFHITEGKQSQEILVGVQKNITAFFTQKLEFKTGNQYLRPGALVSIHMADEVYPILFLHTKSSSDPIGLGIRDDQFSRAFRLKTKVLDKMFPGNKKSNFIFLGDLNTMGMKYPFQKEIDRDFELSKLDNDAKKAGMKRLSKNKPATWSKGSKSRMKAADLDHVVASTHLKFKTFHQNEVDVRGWPNLGTSKEMDQWIKQYSDHALLYFEVQKV